MIRLKIKEVAQQQGISINKLARMADLDNKSVSRIWRDPYQIISTETLDKISRALQVDASTLIESEPALPKDTQKGPQH